MRITQLKNITQFNKLKRMLIFAITFIITYFILVTSLMPRKYNLVAGDIAKANIKAPRQMVDERATEEKREEIKKNVSPPYVKDEKVRKEMIDKLNNLFYKIYITKELSISKNEKISKMKTEFKTELTDDDFHKLLDLERDELSKLQVMLTSTLNQLYTTKIEENKPEDIIIAENFITNEINKSDFSVDIRSLAVKIGHTYVKPNFFIDNEQYEEMVKKELQKVEDVIIQKDEIIVEEGRPITEKQIYILKELGLLNDNPSFKWYIYLSLVCLVVVELSIEYYYLYRYHREVFNDNGKLILISIINSISLIFTKAFSIISPFLIPFACAPMLLILLIDNRVSVIISVLNTLLIGIIVGFNIEIILLTLINAVIGSILIRKMQARIDILYSAIFIAAINVIVTFTVGVLLSSEVSDVILKSGFICVSTVISAILAMGFLPFFESSFDIVTTIKLLELSNLNQPLLKKLLIEAPGTYHHSIVVANLAEIAAEEVGANPVLARVGSYYHDVGKIRRPYFFKENQLGNDNPHNRIAPNLSSLVIISHVKDGMELAKEAKLPKAITDIIEQHHGTSLVKYFYITMKNQSERPEEVNEKDYRYPGFLPSSKEAGIIMLSDSIEAAVRSISEPTVEKIEQMVNNIVKDKLDDGQLNDCELTLRDIEKIKKAFIKSLTGIYHQRIEYPTDKWEKNN